MTRVWCSKCEKNKVSKANNLFCLSCYRDGFKQVAKDNQIMERWHAEILNPNEQYMIILEEEGIEVLL